MPSEPPELFQWTIEINVNIRQVSAGFNLTPDLLQRMIEDECTDVDEGDVVCQVVKAPAPSSIRSARQAGSLRDLLGAVKSLRRAQKIYLSSLSDTVRSREAMREVEKATETLDAMVSHIEGGLTSDQSSD